MPHSLAGVLPVIQTPFLHDDQIDWKSLEREVDWIFDSGADGICTGMVSEILRLTMTERADLNTRLSELKHGRGVFVAAIGAESTKQAVEFGRQAVNSGADGVMAIPPISTALSEDQLSQYFAAIADKLPVPVIVQDASSYVGRPIPHSVCSALLDQFGPEQIQFKPEASPLGPNLSALRDATGGRARIFEGSGGISLVDSYRRGIVGTMPGADVLPAIVVLWRALKRGDDEAAYRISFPVSALIAIQLQGGLDGFLAIEKYILHRNAIIASPRRRQPNAWNLDEETRREVDRLLNRLESVIPVSQP